MKKSSFLEKERNKINKLLINFLSLMTDYNRWIETKWHKKFHQTKYVKKKQKKQNVKKEINKCTSANVKLVVHTSNQIITGLYKMLISSANNDK
jgi:hypothetical protein